MVKLLFVISVAVPAFLILGFVVNYLTNLVLSKLDEKLALYKSINREFRGFVQKYHGTVIKEEVWYNERRHEETVMQEKIEWEFRADVDEDLGISLAENKKLEKVLVIWGSIPTLQKIVLLPLTAFLLVSGLVIIFFLKKDYAKLREDLDFVKKEVLKYNTQNKDTE